MRKYLICLLFSSCLYLSSLSQFTKESEDFLYAKIDSLKKAVPKLSGKAKVDCLNTIVDQYQIMDEDNQMQIDSAGPYAIQAYSMASNMDYKRGLGYAILKLSYIKLLWGQEHKNDNKYTSSFNDSLNSVEKLVTESILIGKELNDFTMIGSAYDYLGWIHGLRRNNKEQLEYHKEAISFIEKQTSQPIKEYIEMNYTNCRDCSGQEFRLAELYSGLGRLGPNKSEAFKKAVLLYKKAEAYPAVSNTYSRLIDIANSNGNNEEVKSLIDEAISYFEQLGDLSRVGDFYRRLAGLIGVRSDSKIAIEYFKKSVFYYRKASDEQGELNATTMVSASYFASGDFENSLEYIKKSILLVEKMRVEQGNKKIKNVEWGRAYYWMARIYSAGGGDYETAIAFMRKALFYYDDGPNPPEFWTAAIGEIYRLKGDYDSAMFYLRNFENSPGIAPGTLYLGRLYISLKQYDKALPLITKNFNATKDNDNYGNLGGDYSDLAKIWLGKKDYQKAISNARTAQILLTKTKRNDRVMENCQVLSEIFTQLKMYDSAYYYLKQYTSLKDSFLTRQFYIRLNDYKKQAEEERKISQINLLNKDNQLKEQKLKQQATLKNGLIIGIILLSLLGIFIYRNQFLKRKNEKLRLQKELELNQLDAEKKQAELHQRAVELEMQALRAQMNPHFIFNCLSSINRFIFKNDNKTASDYLTRFSRLIRMVLIHSQKKLIPLEDELEMIRLYLDLERLRFKDAFDYSITTTNIVDAGNIFIPPLLLQPFCENAVWHGLMHKEAKGHLNISISEVITEETKVLHCIIEDDGIGREKAAEYKSKSAEHEKSMGLKITTERLALLNKENDFDTFYKIEDIINENNACPDGVARREVAGTRVQLKIKYKESVEEYV